MLARQRTTWGIAMTLLGGCTPTPPEVADTGSTSAPSSSTGEESTSAPPGPTTDGSATMASVDGTGTTMPVDDGVTTTGEPSTTSGSSSGGSTSTTGEPADCHPLLAEVLYDAVGGNNNKQWVRLYNPCAVEIELAGAYVLAYGGDSYTYGQFELDGSLDPGACRVVGGPDASNDNGNPVWGQNVDFSPDVQIGGDVADGVALFVGTPADVMADTVPVDAVIYGVSNDSGLLDAEGNMPAPHVGNPESGQSIRRTSLDAEWEVAPSPTPNECPAL